MSRFGLLAIACTIVTCGSAFAQPGFARKVYAHYVPWHPPSHARPDRTANAAAGTAGQIESAAEAGVDGFAVDAVLTPPERIIPTIVDMAEAAKERAPGFEVFPCLDLAAHSDRATWETFLLEWVEAADDLDNTGRVDGRWIIFTYAAYRMPADDWSKLRQTLSDQGHELILIGDVHAPMLHSHDEFAPKLPDYARAFDGLYCFNPAGDEMHAEIAAALAEASGGDGGARINTYTVRPGYYHANIGAFNATYEGAQRYLSTWADAHRLAPDWVSITTWNDYSEHTHVEPSRNFSDVYARITRMEASRFRTGEPNAGEETYWLAAPSEIPNGPGRGPLETDDRRETRFQVLGMSDGSLAETATLRLTRADGAEVLSQTITLSRQGNHAMGTFEWQPDAALETRVLFAEAKVESEAGIITARLPIPIWPRDIAHRFYMPPRWAKLTDSPPPAPALRLVDGVLRVDPLPAPTGLRTDVLHNLRHIPDPASTTAKVADGLDQTPDTPAQWGFHSAAVVSPDARVSWGVPLWIAPADDPLTLAIWRFDGADRPGRDDSIYARDARFHAGAGDLVELADGTRAFASGPDAWIQPPGSFTPIRSALTVECWVRPSSDDGGMLWGDVGAPMLLSLQEGNLPRAMRHTNEGDEWRAASSDEAIPDGEWTHLAGTYDGEVLTLYVNGLAAATTPCAGASGTASTGIGRNPFNGSSIFTGLIDDMRITAEALTAFGPIDPSKARPAEPR